MEKLSTFKIVITALFGASIFFGVITLVIGPDRSKGAKGDVLVWGTIPPDTMNLLISPLNTNSLHVKYEEKDPKTYEQNLIEAFASGKGPDVFFLTNEMIVRFRDKVYTFPKETITERTFRDTYVEEGELYITKGQIVAMPFLVDSMVLYWNRDLFSVAGITKAPSTWTELLAIVPKLVSYTDSGEIIRPAVGLGEFQNIDHPKDILSLLFLQTGSSITKDGDSGLMLSFQENAAESVMRFYTEFARPGNDIYTWNRSMARSREAFIAGDLPMYFGYGSELSLIMAQNPHLNIDVAQVPQLAENGRVTTYGVLTGVAISKATQNALGSLNVATGLTSVDSMKIASSALGTSPARRSLLAVEETDAYRTIFNKSALIAHAWLDPDASATYTLFEDTTESITGGRSRLSEAVYTMKEGMKELIKTLGFGKGVY
ncbi:MAG: extracellular solute-binding protein [Candidatus Yonathbacteria bacterium]|nr:extracellular solute-binding protein [Candidatus Yonathbacteria bacterium]